jgi:hypothetical protein
LGPGRTRLERQRGPEVEQVAIVFNFQTFISVFNKSTYLILSSIMRIQVQCAPEFHNDFFGGKIKYNFTKLIIANLFIIKATLNPFSETFHV